MTKKLIIIGLLILVSVAVFWVYSQLPDAVDPHSSEEMSIHSNEADTTRYGDTTAALKALNPGDSEKLHDANPGIDNPQDFDSIVKVFNYEYSLIEGANKMASSSIWAYDDIIQNVALWGNLCEKNHSSTMGDTFIDNHSDIKLKVDFLCKDFSLYASEIDEFLDIELTERVQGINDRATLEETLPQFGPDAATRESIDRLSSAIENANYAEILEPLWFLGMHRFDGVSDEFRIYTNQPSVETVFAVADSLFCNRLGGCWGQHPVIINRCFQFENRPCSSLPNSISEAINQTLTGHELDTFHEMNTSLTRLLNRHDRGDF